MALVMTLDAAAASPQSSAFQSEMAAALGIVLGKERAQTVVSNFVTTIRTEAADGATKAVRPIVLASIGTAVLATLLAGVALWKSSRK